MKIISIVGARPQFIKLAPICRALQNYNKSVQHRIIHTGQHYDQNMSDALFTELNLPQPDYNLAIGSGTHAEQTGKALEHSESIFLHEQPDHIIVFGDTNATLSGTLAAAKLNIPISHIEAGLRSFNRQMPEEINRIITDRMSTYLFCPNNNSVHNLYQENINQGVYNVGDVMVDQIDYIQAKSVLIKPLQHPYIFMTLHRQETTHARENLHAILLKINTLSKELPIVFSMHPRIKSIVHSFSIPYHKNFYFTEPLGYLDTIQHIQHAQCIFTDSGGIQKEAYMLKTPCITVRSETEWTETLEHGWNRIVGLDAQKFEQAYFDILHFDRQSPCPSVYGDGKAALKIINKIVS